MSLESLGLNLDFCPKLKFKGTLVIAGSARCIWEDLQKVAWSQCDVMAINDLIMHFPGPLKHAYSNDNIWLPKWIAARRPKYVEAWGYPLAHSCNGDVRYKWPWPGHGTSSLNAVYTGLGMGYEQIVLAGIPLDDEGHYFDPPWVKSNFSREVKETDNGPRYWESAARNVFDGRVKSLSGRTRELLGGP